MPVGPTKTKKQKQTVVKTEMHKFGKGELHSGSKTGPVVTNPKQAIAISLAESGQSKSAKQPHPKTNPGDYQNDAHDPEGGYHRKGEAFRDTSIKPISERRKEEEIAQRERLWATGMQTNFMNRGTTSQTGPSGYGHAAPHRDGALRLSGNKNAHRIGARGK